MQIIVRVLLVGPQREVSRNDELNCVTFLTFSAREMNNKKTKLFGLVNFWSDLGSCYCHQECECECVCVCVCVLVCGEEELSRDEKGPHKHLIP